MVPAPFDNEVSYNVWDARYRRREGEVVREATIEESWRRVATAVASVEEKERRSWSDRFFRLLSDFRFLPGGRILAGAGVPHDVTLFNCFVMGTIEDSMDGIFDALKEGALTMQAGGGVGYDFSPLRPSGTRARRVGGIASGPVSFMRIWDAMCATLLSTGARRGAMMATLRCDHPDILSFIEAKRHPGELTHFNLSVLVTDEFMEAVERDEEWPLLFPADRLDGEGGEIVMRHGWGGPHPVPCRVLRRMPARRLWERLTRAAWEHAEPGVLFIDRINEQNNLGWREWISATNPCGEVPLPPYGACNLGSFNLTRFVHDPFTPKAHFDLEALRAEVPVAVRFMDDVIDLSRFPLPAQQEQERGSRRIGLGITGLADTLILLGLHYASEEAREFASRVMETLCHAAYAASIGLAEVRGSFPFFDREACLDRPFIRRLPEALRGEIARHGIRNSHLLAIAPTGTVSLLANNISSALEPVFAFRQQRRVMQSDGSYHSFELEDHAWRLWREMNGERSPPESFVTATELEPHHHLAMQAALQPWVDNAISKTINVPADHPLEAFGEIYRQAWRLGLKGCTTFRPNPVTGSILTLPEGMATSHCCSLEREAD
ncbi:MAG TPA: adenosylcobalamin-dependent ribonucleoside-diphosphate reductase [Thiotrichales bacterium]|nr:adenosylcobalamin-dependent ribonucleoside-diphosphate reductase [Thiotrichales bacterium]